MPVMEGPVLIVGVSGFIGRTLAARLASAGVRVRGLDIVRRDDATAIEFVQADLTDRQSLPKAVDGSRVVFHCARWAGQPRSEEAAYLIDVVGTANLLEACRQVGVARLVYMSSITFYGPTTIPVITEATPSWPVGAYGRSKAQAEERVQAAYRAGVPVVTLRPGQAYGPGSLGGTIEPIRWLAAGRPVLVNGGAGITSPVYIAHLIDAMVAAGTIEGIEGQAFNIADGDFPWREFYGHYARMVGRPLRSVPAFAVWIAGLGAEAIGWLTARPQDLDRAAVRYLTRKSSFATERARTVLGWHPARSTNETMEETERWLHEAGVLRT
ncbi:MAG: NAD-dependent epimerase/dehydratase family protein [bacterium]